MQRCHAMVLKNPEMPEENPEHLPIFLPTLLNRKQLMKNPDFTENIMQKT